MANLLVKITSTHFIGSANLGNSWVVSKVKKSCGAHLNWLVEAWLLTYIKYTSSFFMLLCPITNFIWIHILVHKHTFRQKSLAIPLWYRYIMPLQCISKIFCTILWDKEHPTLQIDNISRGSFVLWLITHAILLFSILA